MKRVKILIVSKDGRTQELIRNPSEQIPLELIAQAGVNYFVIDAASGVSSKKIYLKREGEDLEVSVEEGGEQPDLVIKGYFLYPESELLGKGEGGQPVMYLPEFESGVAAPVHAASNEVSYELSTPESPTAWIDSMRQYFMPAETAIASKGLIDVPVLGAGAMLAAFLGTGLDTLGTAAGGVDTVIQGFIVAGPVISGHGLRVRALKADGSILQDSIEVTESGSFRLVYRDYAGVIRLQVMDSSVGSDYWDEATRQGKDLDGVLEAVIVVSAGGAQEVYVTPLTTLMAEKIPEGTTEASVIEAAGKAVSKLFGLGEASITEMIPQAVVTKEGKSNPEANAYGEALAVISHAEAAQGKSTGVMIRELANALDVKTGSLVTSSGATAVEVEAAKNSMVLGAMQAMTSGEMSTDASQKLIASVAPTSILLRVAAVDDDASIPASNDALLKPGESSVQLVVLGSMSTGEKLILSREGVEVASHTVTESEASAGKVLIELMILEGWGEGQQPIQASLGNFQSNILPLMVDLAPSITAAVLSGSRSGTLVEGDQLHVVLTSSEAISGWGTGDKVTLGLGSGEVEAIYVSSSGNEHRFSYTVVTGDVDSDGVELKGLTVSGNVKDGAGNQLQSTLPSNTDTVKVDTVAPTITQVRIAGSRSGILLAGDEVRVVLTSSEALTGLSTEDKVGLVVGSRHVEASYVSSSGNEHRFIYKVVSNDLDLDGVDLAGLTVSENVQDSAGHQLQVNLPPLSGSIEVDAVIPIITEVSLSGTDSAGNVKTGTLVAGNQIKVVLSSSEPLTGLTRDVKVVLTVGNREVEARYESSDGNEHTFSYEVLTGDVTSTGVVIKRLEAVGVKDSAGNALVSTLPESSGRVEVDAVAPTLSINPVASDDKINAVEKAAGVTVSGTSSVEDNQTVAVAWGTNSKTATVTNGSWSVSFAEAEIPADAAESSITADVSDAAGNPAVQASRVMAIDTATPTVTIDVVAVDNQINVVEKAAGVTVSGTSSVEDNQMVTVTWGSSSQTALVTNSSWSVSFAEADIPADAAESSITADVSDAAGNPAAQASRVVAIDTSAPTVTIDDVAVDDQINAVEKAAGVTVSGTSSVEDNQMVTVTWGSSSQTALVTNSSWSVSFAEAEIPADAAESSITADVSDAAGNPAAQASRVVAIDTSAPTVTIDVVAVDDQINAVEKAAGVTVSGTSSVEDNQMVTVTWGTVSQTALVTNSSWSVSFAEADIPADAAESSITADVSDAAGNPAAQASRVVAIDTSAPTVTIDVVAVDDQINAVEKAAGVTVSGTSSVEDNQLVTVTWGSSSQTALVSNGSWSVSFAEAEIPADAAESSITADVSDAAGNPAVQASKVVAIDTSAPTVMIDVVAVDDQINAVEKAAGVTVSGTSSVEDNQMVTVNWGSSSQTALVTNGSWSVSFAEADIPADAAESSITADVSDAAGNPAVQASRVVAIDTSAPTVTIDVVAVDDQINAVEKAAGVTVSGTSSVEDNQMVTVTWGTVSQTALVTNSSWSVSFAEADIPADAAESSITADVSDAAGNPAVQASRVVAIDTSAPTVTIDDVAVDNQIDAVEKAAGVTVSGTSSVEDNQEVTVNWGTVSQTALVTNSSWSVSFAEAEIPADAAESSITADVSDAAGNPAVQASRVVAIDTSAPTVMIDVVAVDDQINAVEKAAGVTVSGTSSVEDNQLVTVTWGSSSQTALVSNGSWSVSFAEAEIPADAAESSITADVSDAAGNPAVQASRVVAIDTSAPTVTIDVVAVDDQINAVEKAAGVTVSGTSSVEDNQMVTVTWGSSSQTALVSNGSWSVSFAEAEIPADAAESSITADVSDAAGNPAVQASRVVAIDTSAPTVTIDVVAVDDQINAVEKAAGVTVSGTSSVEDNQMVTVTWGSSSQTALVTNSSWSVSFAEAEIPADAAESSITADVSDAAGNPAAQASRVVAIDTSAPTVTIDVVAVDDQINAVEKAAGVTVSGTSSVEDNQMVTVTWGTVSQTALVTNSSWSVSFAEADIPADAAESSITADVSDAAGNPAAQASRVVAIDTSAPTVTIDVVAVDDQINAVEKAAGVTVSGTSSVEDNQLVTVTWGSSSQTALVSNGSWSVSFAEAEIPADAAESSITADVSDAAGNPAVQASKVVAIDTSAPTVMIDVVAVDDRIDAAEKAAGVTVSGTSSVEDNQMVTVTWGTSSQTALVTNSSWSVSFAEAEIPADAAESSITADVSDAAGNPAVQASKVVAIDTSAPTVMIDVVAVDDRIDAAEKAAGVTVSGTSSVEDNQMVTVTWGTSSQTALVTNSSWSVSFAEAEIPADATESSITADVSDAAGNPAAQASRVVAIDTSAPTVMIDVVAVDDQINAVEKAAGVTVSGTSSVEDNQMVTVTWGSSSQTALVTNSSWSVSFAEADIPADAAESSITADVSDAAGNPAAQASRVVAIDTSAPTVTIDVVAVDDQINAVEKAAGVTVSGTSSVEDNQLVTVTWGTSSQTALVTNNSWSVSFAEADIPADATESSITADVSDAAGNPAAQASRVVAIDTSAPTVTIDVVAVDDQINAVEKAAGVTVSGTSSVEDNQLVTVTWGSSSQTALVSNGSWSVSFAEAEIPADAAESSITADVSDAAGNPAVPASRVVAIDTSAPTVMIDVVAVDDQINAVEKAAGVTVSGTSSVEDNQMVTVNWGTSSQTALVSNGSWSVSFAAADIPANAAESSITADVSDAAGNPAAQASRVVAIDTSAPTVMIDVVAVDDRINAAEKAAGVTVSGTSSVEDNQLVTVTWGTSSQTALVTNNSWSVSFAEADIPADATESSITADVSDAAGNPAAQASRVVAIDTSAPTVTIDVVAVDDKINAVEKAAGVTVSGTSSVEDNQLVTVNWGTVSQTALVTNSSWSVSFAEADIPADAAESSITADVSDAAGNPAAQASRVVAIDTSAPTVTIDVVAVDDQINAVEKAAGVTVSGTSSVEDNQLVTVTWGSSSQTALVSNGSWSVSFAEAEIPADAAESSITADVSDAAGNPAVQASRVVAIDTSAPTVTIDVVAVDDQINAVEKAAGVTVSGTSSVEDNQMVTVTWGSSSQTALVTNSSWSVSFAEAEIPADAAESSITADVSDAAGNPAAQASRVVAIDTSAPTVTIDVVAVDDQINAVEKAAGVTVSGTSSVEDNQMVTVTWGTVSQTALVTNSSWSVSFAEADIPADAAESSITADVSDAAGNPAAQASRVVAIDTSAPTVTIDVVAVDDQINAVEKAAGVTVSGTSSVEDNQLVTVTWGSSSQTALVSNGSWSVSFAEAEIPADAAESSITADVSDAAGNPAVQASKVVAIDTSAPTVMIDVVAVDDQINAVEKAAGVTVSGTSSVEDNQMVTVNWGSSSQTALVTNGSWSVSFAEADIPADAAESSITADVSDAAGNPAVQASRVVAIDTSAPTVTIDVVAVDDQINAVEKAAGVTVSGTSSVEDNQMVTVTWGTVSQTALVTNSSWSVSFAEADIPADAAESSITADVSDAAGNPAVQASRVVAIDTSAPTVTIDDVAVDNQINAVEKAAGVTVSGTSSVEDNQEVTVNWGTVSQTAFVTNSSWSVSFAEAEIPADATESSITADVSDAAGNPAAQASRVVAIDTSAPTVTIDVVAVDDQINAVEKAAGVTVSGTSSVEDNQLVTVTWGSSSQTALVSNGSWSVSFAEAEIPADAAESSITADVSDAAGNPAVQASKVVAIDTSAPTVMIDVVAVDDRIDAAEKAAGVTVSGTSSVEDNQMVTVTWGTSSQTALVTNSSWSVSFAEAEIPADAAESSITADVSDAAGNPAVQASKVVAIDTSAPTVMIDVVAVDDRIDAAEKAAGVTVSGTSSVEDNQMVTVTWGTSSQTALVTNSSWSVSFAEAEIPADATESSITADVSDAAGNPAAQASRVVAIDTSAPTVMIDVVAVDDQINAVEKAAGVTVSGTSSVEDNQMVTVTWGSSSQTALVTNSSWSVSFAEADIPADAAESSITADVSDAAGNPAAQASRVVAIDTSAPTVTIDVVAVDDQINAVEKAAGVTVSGTSSVEDNQLVTVTWGTSSQTALVTNNSWSVSFAEADIPADATESSITADVSDAAGNPAAQASRVVAIDTSAPTVTIDVVAVDDQINAVEKAAGVTVSGTSSVEDRQMVTVTWGTVSQTALVTNSSWSVSFTEADIPADAAESSITADVSDAAGNPTQANKTVIIDTAAPTFLAVAISGVDANNVSKTDPLTPGDKIRVELLANEALLVTGTPTYTIDVGGVSRQAVYSSGVGTTTLVFYYTIVAGDSDSSGGITANNLADTIELGAGGSITDRAGNNATITIVPAVPAGSNSVSVINDTTPPSIDSVVIIGATGQLGTWLNVGDEVSITAHFTEAVVVDSTAGVPSLTLTLGTSTVQANYASGSGSSHVVFKYTIASGDTASNGIAIGADALTLNGGSITDQAGNTATLTHAQVAADANYLVDTIAPTFSSLTISGTDSTGAAKTSALGVGDKIKVVVAASEIMRVNGTPTLTIDVGGESRTATYSSGANSNNLVFYYTIQNGDIDNSGGITTVAQGISGVTDRAGNAPEGATPIPAAGSNTVTVDAVGAPSATITTLSLSADTGTSDSDFITRTGAQTISGTLSEALGANQVVQISLNNGSTWSNVSTQPGADETSFSHAATLSGSNTLQVRVNDTNTEKAGTAYSHSYTVDTSITNTFSLGEAVTERPIISGSTDPGASVVLELDNDNDVSNGYEVRYEVTANAVGYWSVNTSLVTPTSGNLTWTDGQTVNAKVTVSDAAGNSATAVSNEVPVNVSIYNISNATVIEGQTGTNTMSFLITRTGDLSSAGAVTYTINANSSASSADYSGESTQTLNFAAGETSKLVSFTVNGDYLKEINDKLQIDLSNPVNGALLKSYGTGTLLEMDPTRMQVVYSLNDVNPNLATAAIRVRRGSDNAEQDIGFDVYGKLDTDALLAFVGTSKGYVTTWYDQSGNGRDMKQATHAKQGVVASDSAVVRRADDSVGISFNSGLNGGYSMSQSEGDIMLANGEAATDWTSVLVVMKAQSTNSSRNGTAFNLLSPTTSPQRLSSHYGWSSTLYWDVGNLDTASGRLSGGTVTQNVANDMVFEAHSGNTSSGTASMNYVDAKQAIFMDGVNVVRDGTLPTTFPTSATWALGGFGVTGGLDDFQAMIVSEFMVYLAKDNSTPDIQTLRGTSDADVLTYKGETLLGIDGGEGYDVLYLNGAVNFNPGASLADGMKNIEQLWAVNGSANRITLTDESLATNGGALTINMDVGDSVAFNGVIHAYSEGLQTLILGTTGSEILIASFVNDHMIGRGGSDTFKWLATQTGTDKVVDFATSSSNGQDIDTLDISGLLQGYVDGAGLNNWVTLVEEGSNTTLIVDLDGLGSGATTQTIVLEGVSPGYTLDQWVSNGLLQVI